MYNFLVTAQEGAWEGSSFQFPRGRFLEFTEDEIAKSFQELQEPQIQTLLKLPCLFAYEGESEPMRLGKLTKIRQRGRYLYLEFELDADVPPIAFDSIAPFQAMLDIRGWELNRSHWAIKDESLLEILTERDLIPVLPASLKVHRAELPPPAAAEHQVASVGKFIELVLSLNHGSKEIFYRGHSIRSQYRLEPSLFRKDRKGNFKYLDSEDLIYRELLVSNSVDFHGDSYTLDRLVRMQHYFLPTRLLDITSNPLIALYFACKSHESEVGEVITLALDRERLKYFDSDTASCIANLARLPRDSKRLIDYKIESIEVFNELEAVKRLLHFIKEEKPYFEGRIRPDDLRSVLCVKGKHTTSRIAFQSGAFLLFGQDASLDEKGTSEITLTRIAIEDKATVRNQLDKLNINDSTVFPYIENSAKYIADKFSFRDKL
jgi:FRG domain